MRSGAVVVDGARLHVQRLGTGRTPLVLLHGLTDDGACWARVAAALADDFDLVIPDARGHGRSSRLGEGTFTVEGLANDVVGILGALGIRSALLFGHSMGAITAAAVAADRPDLVRGVVLEDPPLDLPLAQDDVRRRAMQADIATWSTLDAASRPARARLEHPEWDPSETDPWADAKAAVDPAVADHLALFDDLDWRGLFGRIDRPGLLIIGDQALGALVSPTVANEAIQLWPLGRVVAVSGAGHCIHRDRWTAAVEPIRSYLLEQERRRAAPE